MLFQNEMCLPIDSEVIPPQNLYSLNSENEVQEVIQVLLESRDVGKGVYELRNAHNKILKKKVNINRLKMYTCSKDIEGSSDGKAKGEHEEFNQEELLKQLHSPNRMCLWRTGASELLCSTEEDDYFDVSVRMFDVFYYKCISFISQNLWICKAMNLH